MCCSHILGIKGCVLKDEKIPSNSKTQVKSYTSGDKMPWVIFQKQREEVFQSDI